MPRLINAAHSFLEQHGRPSFHVYGASNEGNARFGDWQTIVTNIGGCMQRVTPSGSYQRSRFTAPVKGAYHFGFWNIGKNQSTISRHYVYKNGSSIGTGEMRVPTTSVHGWGSKQNVLELVAGDYVEFYAYNDTANFGWYQSVYSGCWGFLIS